MSPLLLLRGGGAGVGSFNAVPADYGAGFPISTEVPTARLTQRALTPDLPARAVAARPTAAAWLPGLGRDAAGAGSVNTARPADYPAGFDGETTAR